MRSCWPGRSPQMTVVRATVLRWPRCSTSTRPGTSTSWSIAAAIISSLARVRCTSSAPLSVFSCWTASSGLFSTAATRGSFGRLRLVLVGDELGLHGDADELVDRLDDVLDCGHAALRQRHQPGRRAPLTCLPAGDRQCAVRVSVPARMSRTRSCCEQFAVSDVERLVVDEQAHDLAVGDVDDRLAVLGIAEARFGVRQRPGLVERVQVGARQAVRLALVEVAAQPDVAVGQREQRLGLRPAGRGPAWSRGRARARREARRR